MRRALILYIPVLHDGYLKLFEKHAKTVDSLFILGPQLIKEFTFFEKEIRAVRPTIMREAVDSLGFFSEVELLNREKLRSLNKKGVRVITANEEMLRRLADKYLDKANVIFDRSFLRWDEKSVLSQKPPKHFKVSKSAYDRKIMREAKGRGENSSCWWRQLGATIVKNRKSIIESYNRHTPSEYSSYAHGDPRDFIKPGELNHIATVLHAEQGAITEAARRGVSLKGASIYTPVFPCGMCAKQIAFSGIKRCYFQTGAASLGGEEVMVANGVEIILVK